MTHRLMSLLSLLAAVLSAAGGVLLSTGSWAEVIQPQGLGGIAVAVGGAVVGWMATPWGQARRRDNGG